jgi:hypothetical protein
LFFSSYCLLKDTVYSSQPACIYKRSFLSILLLQVKIEGSDRHPIFRHQINKNKYFNFPLQQI